MKIILETTEFDRFVKRTTNSTNDLRKVGRYVTK